MIFCIQNLALFCPFSLKILINKKQILVSIKDSNSVAHLPKHDVVIETQVLSIIICIMIMVNFRQFIPKIWSKNQILTSVRGVGGPLFRCKFAKHNCILMLILSMINIYKNLVSFCQFVLSILSKNQMLMREREREREKEKEREREAY